MPSSYQPFLIGEGKSTTGLFQYLDSWVKPQDAFDLLENAYVYRGSLYKRNGTVLYPGGGFLRYCDNELADTGDGGSVYSGTLSNIPLYAGTVIVTVLTSGGFETYTDDGLGNLTGSLFGTGNIDYTTGIWDINTGANTVAVGDPIMIEYTYAPTQLVTPINNPIMGIKNFINQTDNTKTLVVLDTRRASVYNNTTLMFDPICCMEQPIWISNGVNTGTATATFPALDQDLGFTNIAPYSVFITDGTNTIQDDGTGGFLHNGNALPDGTNFANTMAVNYTTGIVTLRLVAPSAAGTTYTASFGTTGDYFTGDYTNFFNATNWKPTDQATGYLYLTNNVDRVTTFDGNCLSRLPYSILYLHYLAGINDIETTLDVKVYKNSLLFIRPTLVGSSAPEAQTIRSSAPFVPQNMVTDVTGNGAATVAPTGDWIFAAQFLRDQLVVFFQESTWLFRFQFSVLEPFRWDKVNDSRNTNAPYGSIGYDLRATSMGSKGLIYCDGNNVDRYDLAIIDQFLDIEPKAFGQCFGQRYDTLNQSWMLYPSVGDASGGNVQLTSSRVFVYNFLEDTWAIYVLPLSCLGLGFTTTDLTWADFAPGASSDAAGSTWEDWDFAWLAYQNIALQPALLGGDEFGFVYQLNVTNTDNGAFIITNIQTKRLNPFINQGMKATFGYLDVYYEVAPEVVLNFNFYLNNSSDIQLSLDMTLDGASGNHFAWKRLYLNTVGEFIQIGITDNGASNYKILGMILHAKPSGRLTPGTFL